MKSQMPKILFLAILISLIYGCRKDSDFTPITNTIVEAQNKRFEKVVSTETVMIYLRGSILDESGDPLNGVEVKVGSKSTFTDTEGSFSMDDVSVNKDFVVVSARKSGYMPGFRTFSPTGGSVNSVIITLLDEGAPKVLDAKKGGKLLFESNAIELDFPKGVISDADGFPYTGLVNVYARYLDPQTEIFTTAMPGTLAGITDADELTGIISYGMAVVELRDGSNKPLQIKAGKTVSVTMPALFDMPEEMPFWHFNEIYGLWVEVGRASKLADKYTYEANHFSYWNLDVFSEDAYPLVTVRVVDGKNNPISNLIVDVNTSGNDNRFARVVTDEKGMFGLLFAPRNLNLRIKTDCETLEFDLTLLSPNVTVVVSSVLNATAYEISGVVKDCEEVVYGNKLFSMRGIDKPEINFYGKTDGSGNFSASILTCSIFPSQECDVEVSVFMSPNIYKLDTITLKFSSETVKGTVNFCGKEEEVIDKPWLNQDLFYGTVTDIDGNKYATIQIGTQIWMAENLKTSKYNDGLEIINVEEDFEWANLSTGAWCYYNNDSSKKEYYGKLYNSYAARTGKLCPSGWRIPNNADWGLLISNLGDSGSDIEKFVSGIKLRSTSLWPNHPLVISNNESGFSALPSGRRFVDYLDTYSNFEGIGTSAFWWSETGNDTMGYSANLYAFAKFLLVQESLLKMGNSCRCVKD